MRILWTVIILMSSITTAYHTIQPLPPKQIIPVVARCTRCQYPLTNKTRENITLASRHIESRLGRLSQQDNNKLLRIIYLESKGNILAKNPKSTAYGLGQLLRSTYHSVHVPYKTTCTACQLEAMRVYIHSRYGTPKRAYIFWLEHHWY